MVVRGQGEMTILEVAEALAKSVGSRYHLQDFPGRNGSAPTTSIAEWSRWTLYLYRPSISWTSMPTKSSAAFASSPTPPALAVRTPATTAPTWSSTSGASMLFLPSECSGDDSTWSLGIASEEVALLDSNFPVELPRALEIARGILDSGVKFRWTFQASTDFLCRMSEDEVRLLGASGVSHMGFGTESTSESVLKLMNKRHQRVNEMYETARKAHLAVYASPSI